MTFQQLSKKLLLCLSYFDIIPKSNKTKQVVSARYFSRHLVVRAGTPQKEIQKHTHQLSTHVNPQTFERTEQSASYSKISRSNIKEVNIFHELNEILGVLLKKKNRTIFFISISTKVMKSIINSNLIYLEQYDLIYGPQLIS